MKYVKKMADKITVIGPCFLHLNNQVKYKEHNY